MSAEVEGTPHGADPAYAGIAARALEWGRGATAVPPARSLATLLAAPARATPEAPALVVLAPGRRVWSYAELDAEAGRRAAAYRRAGIGPGDRVGVVATRVAELVPSVLALLRTGAAYVPLDPAAPDARWAVVADQAALTAVTGPSLALEARAAVLGSTAALAWDIAAATSDATSYDAASGDFSDTPDIDPQTPAYVLFTSGSTGTPKGVVVTHANVLARIPSYLALSDGPVRYLLHSSFTFDGAVGGMYSTLARGGCLVLPPDDLAGDPGLLAGVIREERLTHLEPVPSWYAALLDLARPGDLAGVRLVILGGEVLPPSLIAASRAAAPQAVLVNDYGPTEITVAATCFVVPPDWTGGRVPIGRPHVNTTAYVLDDDRRLVGPGVVGALWIGGPGVAAGYLGRPDDPAFRPDPFADEPGARMYNTGDRAAWTEDGLLLFHGRADRQVKVRGQRVEPDEVEVALAALPDVQHAAVQVDRASTGDRLVAFVSRVPGSAATREDVLQALGRAVPKFMVPDLLTVLDAMPLSAGGKVDRPALDRLAAQEQEAAYEPPADAVEQEIADAFAVVLERPRVGRRDDFFALGGQSLASARVVGRLRDGRDGQPGYEVTPADLLECATPAALASVLRDRPRRLASVVPPLAPVPREPDVLLRVPATPRQESFWVLEFVPGGAGAHNLVEVLTFPADTSDDRLTEAVKALVARHAALRTGLELDGSQLMQLVAPQAAITLDRLGDFADEDALHTAADDYGRQPFDLARPGLIRAGIARTPSATVLVLVVHHTVTDGWSTALLVGQLARAVAGQDLGAPPAISFADYAEHLHARIEDAEGTAATEVIGRRIDAAAEHAQVLLPYDRPAGPVVDVRAGLVRRVVPAAHVEALAAVAASVRATPFTALAATLGALLARSSGVPRVALGSPVSGRGNPLIDDVVGCFINTGMFFVDTTGAPTFTELVRRVARDAASEEPHRWLPMEIPLRRRADPVLTDVVTVLLNLLELPATGSGATGFGRHSRPCGFAYSDLDLYLEPVADGLKLEVVFPLARFEPATIETLVDRWLHVVAAAAAEPDAPVDRLPVLTPQDAERVRALEGNRTWQPGEDLALDPADAPDAVRPLLTALAGTGTAQVRDGSVHAAAVRAAIGADDGDWRVVLLAQDPDAHLGALSAARHVAKGRRLLLADPATRSDPHALAAILAGEGVELLEIRPSDYRLLLDLVTPDRLASLRRVVLAGEDCHPSLVAAHLHAAPGAELVNTYGAGPALAHVCQRDDPDLDRIPVGRPRPGALARVADSVGAPTAIGVPGELLLGGPLHPEADVPVDGELWLRTGVLARWTFDGELESLGRLDSQVVVNGFRIEPGEVEAVLTELDDVVRAVVGVRDVAGRPVLVAWVGTAPDAAVTSAAVRAHCAERLPGWSIPAVVVPLAQLPTTVDGAVDRDALPTPPADALGATHVPPRTPTEERVAAIWRDLLGKPVGVDEDFFLSGGQSLLAARMVARVRDEFDVPLSLAVVLAAPRIADIAAHVDAQVPAAGGSGEPAGGLAELSIEEATALLERMDELTDEQVEQLLARLDAS